jgi:TolB-like protein/tRNA A-37 threonylcarbamoyl transferase component Bud32/Tfp pilus assembly protein PilF
MTEFGAVHDGESTGDSRIMTSASRVCRKCGAEIFADAPEGLCTACLFETALDLFTDNPVVGVGDPGPPGDPLRESKRKADRAKAFADFGDYELLEVIGRGGQGVVYRARQKSLNRTVALKVIGLGHWATEAHLKRFRREAEAAARLDHSGIVPIYEVGERDGSCYFSMKLVEGGQLDEVAKRESMPIRRAVELIAKVARTVHYAHDHSILHRDIKPGNILLDAKGEPHLTDFGLARLVETESTVTRTLEVLGTPSYMAPEQAVGNNEAVSSVTDVYGIGAVLYQLLTGHPPFAGGTTYETIKLLLDTEPRQPRLWNSKIDRDLSTISLKCLEKDPARRYSSALALAEDLERWLKHEPILARRTGIFTRGKKWVRRNPTSALLAASLVALAATAGWIVWKSEFIRHPLTTGIAVLPFENLSDEKEQAFFADGVQDDILTKLAKIADLKVISRTSVMQYRGKQNVRDIGNVLRVSHVLEGTVRRFGGKVHVNAQLVDTRTDAGIWAEEYDRNLNDVFAIEAEVAQSIANRLRTKLSAHEKEAMQERPTRDLVAYDLYVQATALIDNAGFQEHEKQGNYYFQATELLNQAVVRDSAFLLAYCRLAEAHDELYFNGFDHTPSRLDLAKSAIDSAFRLKADSGEAHLALGTHLYHGYLDYDRARDELAVAARTLPNNARIFEWTGYLDRRQNRWSDAARNFERAIELDPRNVKIVSSAAGTYHLLREYKREGENLDRLIVLEPNNIDHRLERARINLRERADTRAEHAFLENIPTDNSELASARLDLALYERDAIAADRALAELRALGKDTFDLGRGGVQFSLAYLQGLVARMKGDAAGARAAFTAARVQQEEAVRAQPDYGPPLAALGLIDAALGRKEEALSEGRRALELTPVANNPFDTVDVFYCYAVTCAWTGERDLAIEQLETVAKIPAGPSYGDLRLSPNWDSLRGDPRFEKIVASLAPKEIVSK